VAIETGAGGSLLGRWSYSAWRPPHLGGLVDHLWAYDGPSSHRRKRVFPNGRVELFLNFGDPINPRTARAQMTGAIIWGWGMAAMEASHHDPALGRWLSKNLAGVAIPVNADIPGDIQIHFVDEFDAHESPVGAKGIGELGATGVAASVANAVFHATGKRVWELPITPESS
jgi:CO/xanthine dehydrogenase Mo-binding subunit